MRLIILASIIGCATPKTFTPSAAKEVALPATRMGCETPCGISAPLETDCVGLARYESDILTAYVRRTGIQRARLCEALNGYKLLVVEVAACGESSEHSHAWWYQPRKQYVYGLHFGPDKKNPEKGKQIFIGNRVWKDSALAHEFGHVFDPLLPQGPSKSEHPDWTKKGICPAVNDVGTLKDDCEGKDDYQ